MRVCKIEHLHFYRNKNTHTYLGQITIKLCLAFLVYHAFLKKSIQNNKQPRVDTCFTIQKTTELLRRVIITLFLFNLLLFSLYNLRIVSFDINIIIEFFYTKTCFKFTVTVFAIKNSSE